MLASQVKMEDLNADTLDAAIEMIAGTARSMGLLVDAAVESVDSD